MFENVNIDKTAIVEEGAKFGKNVKVGPFCVVSRDACLKDNVELKGHVVIENKVTIGEGTVVHSFSVIGGPPQNIKHHGVGAEILIGNNNVIREHVTINLGTETGGMRTIIGNDCFIMTASHIAHDCTVGNKVIMANNATLGGHVKIEDNVFIGGMSAVHQFVRIGKNAMIGGMSGVNRDVSPFTIVMSDPAGMTGLNIVGLKRSGFGDEDIYALREAYKTLFDTSPGKNICGGIKEISEKFANNKHVEYVVEFLKAKSSRGICRPKIFCDEEMRA